MQIKVFRKPIEKTEEVVNQFLLSLSENGLNVKFISQHMSRDLFDDFLITTIFFE